MPAVSLNLTLLSETLAVARLSPGDPIPEWVFSGEVWSVARTADELSVVCRDGAVPGEARAERGWRCLKLEGPIDFALTGILAAILAPLAAAAIPIFAFSTYDTDYVMVKRDRLGEALDALRGAGHRVGEG